MGKNNAIHDSCEWPIWMWLSQRIACNNENEQKERDGWNFVWKIYCGIYHFSLPWCWGCWREEHNDENWYWLPATLHLIGIYKYPGVSTTTAVTQDMDQKFESWLCHTTTIELKPTMQTLDWLFLKKVILQVIALSRIQKSTFE